MICHTKYVSVHQLEYLLLLETCLSSYFVGTYSMTVDCKQVVSMSLNVVKKFSYFITSFIMVIMRQ